MPTPPLTEKDMRAVVEAYKANGYSKKLAAEAMGMKPGTFDHRFMRAVMAGLDNEIVHSAPAGHQIKGVSTLYNQDGSLRQQWVKTKTDGPDLDQIIEAIKGAFDEYQGSAEPTFAPEVADAELVTVYPLADWHVGLLAWGREVGEDWDLSIAERDIRQSMERLVASSPRSSTAVVLGLGDLLHSDNYDGVTSRSKHRLDVDGRYPKVLQTAVKLVVHTIELALQKHEQVLVRLIPGNHDDQSAIAVTLALAARYDGHPRVKVDDDPGRFWWWRFGKVFLGAAHGDIAKMKDLPLIMASRHPEDWGASKHRLIFTGHIHHREKLNAREFGDVDVESFNSPTAKDAYSHGAGFVSKRSVHSLTFHEQDGEISRSRVAIVQNS
jgi:hypothetical protein